MACWVVRKYGRVKSWLKMYTDAHKKRSQTSDAKVYERFDRELVMVPVLGASLPSFCQKSLIFWKIGIQPENVLQSLKNQMHLEFCPIFSPRQHFTKSFRKLVLRCHGNECYLSVNKRRLLPQYASKLHETCTICFLGGLGLTEYFSYQANRVHSSIFSHVFEVIIACCQFWSVFLPLSFSQKSRKFASQKRKHLLSWVIFCV